MTVTTQWILIVIAAMSAGLLVAAVVVGVAFARLAVAYAAKIAASALFVAGRDDASLQTHGDLDNVRLVRWQPDVQTPSVTARLGPIRRTAVWRPGLGTCLIGAPSADLPASNLVPREFEQRTDDPRPWPTGDQLPDVPAAELAEAPQLDRVLDRAFAEPESGDHRRRTRAVVVVQDGHLLAERYAPGFSRHTPLLGWSMAKSVVSALAGILVAEGQLRIEDPADVPAWQHPGDPRRAITVDQLLRMNSGLRFGEAYRNPFADAATMLFASRDTASYAAARPLDHAPGTRWHYSSGTTNILSAVLRRAAGSDERYHALPGEELFEPIGMRHAVLEADASGTFVGSSFCWATARDWARFGLLFLHDGCWHDRRILPEGWVRYCCRPTPEAPRGCYGAHWWCNAGSPGAEQQRPMPRLPSDHYAARGYQGQSLNVFPSQRTVIVRLGLSDPHDSFETEEFLAGVLGCLQR